MALRPSRKSFSSLLLKRVVFLIFAVAWLAVFGYIAGSFQGFLENTQLALLRTAAFFGSLLLIGSLIGIAIDVGFAVIRRSPKMALNGIGYIFLALNGLAIAVFSLAALTVAAGNSP